MNGKKALIYSIIVVAVFFVGAIAGIYLERADISATCTLMVGNPGETIGTLDETRKLIKFIKPDAVYNSGLRIYPGTPLEQFAINQGVYSRRCKR